MKSFLSGIFILFYANVWVVVLIVIVMYRCATWGVVGPSGVLSGLNQGVAIASYELAGGLYDLFAKPIKGAANKGLAGAGQGAVDGVVSFFARMFFTPLSLYILSYQCK